MPGLNGWFIMTLVWTKLQNKKERPAADESAAGQFTYAATTSPPGQDSSAVSATLAAFIRIIINIIKLLF